MCSPIWSIRESFWAPVIWSKQAGTILPICWWSTILLGKQSNILFYLIFYAIQKLKLSQLYFWQNLKQSYGKNNLTPWQPFWCSRWSILRSRNIFFKIITLMKDFFYPNKIFNFYITAQIYINYKILKKSPKGPKQILCRVWLTLTRLYTILFIKLSCM